jgi:hypothetical protein
LVQEGFAEGEFLVWRAKHVAIQNQLFSLPSDCPHVGLGPSSFGFDQTSKADFNRSID